MLASEAVHDQQMDDYLAQNFISWPFVFAATNGAAITVYSQLQYSPFDGGPDQTNLIFSCNVSALDLVTTPHTLCLTAKHVEQTM
jgi:hypothetical protein